MKKFWSYVTRGKYSIGCTGQSVYVYENDIEIVCLKGFKYTYKSCISPNLDYFALKSNTGIMYVYSLKDFSLVRKVRFMKSDSSQDNMFTFSLNGKSIISVDTYQDVHNCISCFSVPNLELKRRLFDDSDTIEPCVLELTDEDNIFYVLMAERNKNNIVYKYFVALIKDDKILDKKYISEKEFDLYLDFKELEYDGFTEKAKEWSSLKYDNCDASKMENQKYSLADFFEKHI